MLLQAECCLYFFYSISGSGCAAATAMQSVLRTTAQVLSVQLLNYAKAYIYIIVLWKYQLEHTSEQMGSMQICIVISATATSLIGIKKTCRLDGRCSARVKRMWFSAIAKSSDVTHYIVFIHSRQLWFRGRGSAKSFNQPLLHQHKVKPFSWHPRRRLPIVPHSPWLSTAAFHWSL